MYATVSKKVTGCEHISDKIKRNKMKRENIDHRMKKNTTGSNSSFTEVQLVHAIKNLGNNRTAGQDGVYNEFIKNISAKAREEALDIINIMLDQICNPF